MKRPIHELLALCFAIGILTTATSQAAPTKEEAAELAKAKAIVENSNASTAELNDTVARLTSLIKKNPNLDEAYCFRGEIFDKLRKPIEGFNDFNRAIEVNPKLGRAYIDRGISMFFRSNFTEAIRDFDKAIENGEKSFIVYQNRGASYQQLNQHEKAIQDFTTTVDDKPNFVAYLMRANSYAAINQLEPAIKDLDTVLATKNLPALIKTDAYEKRGFCLAKANKLKEAIEDFTAAAEGLSGEKKGRMISLRGSAHFKLGEKDAAEADRKLALSSGYPKEGLPDKPISMSAADQVRRLEEAIKPLIEEAKKTLPDAKAKFLKGLPTAHRFFVTTKLYDDENHYEQVFVLVDGWSGSTISGTLGNQVKLRGYKQGDKLKVDEKDVLDWTISKPDGTEEGNVIGKFLDNWKG